MANNNNNSYNDFFDTFFTVSKFPPVDIYENNNIQDFDTDELDIDLNNPLNIECQPSYDGTVNLILNDDKNPPRIINTRFSKMEGNRYKVISRDQLEQTNLYRVGSIDQQTRLFRNINKIPKIDLLNVSNTCLSTGVVAE